MNKKRAWMLFDFANQPFHTLVVTFIYVIYFNKYIVGNEEQGQILISWMQSGATFLIAIAAPIIGAITDQAGHRKRWMWFFSGLFVLACFGLLNDSNVGQIMICYAVAYFAAEMTLITINAYLPEVSRDDDVGKVSGEAWGYGYIGGLILLIVFLAFLQPVDGQSTTLLGFPALLGEKAALYSAPASAIWYMVFMIPFFMIFKNEKGEKNVSTAVQNGLSSLKSSFKKAWADARLRWFFISSLVYRDALIGVFSFGTLYALNVLYWETTILGAYGIALSITGVFGGVFGGYFDKKYGASFVIRITLIMFTILSFIMLSTNRSSVVFVPVSESSSLPDIVFFVCGLFIGAGAGALQGISRGMVVPECKGKMPIGEAFGIYGMFGRATAFLAPLMVGTATALTGSAQLGIWPILLLFVIAYLTFRHFEKQ